MTIESVRISKNKSGLHFLENDVNVVLVSEIDDSQISNSSSEEVNNDFEDIYIKTSCQLDQNQNFLKDFARYQIGLEKKNWASFG